MGFDSPIIRHAPAVAGVGLGVLVAAAPLPFGSVEPEAVVALRLGAALLLALAVPALVAPRRRRGTRRTLWQRLQRSATPALALLALAGVGACQSLPWPPVVVGLTSPGHVEAWTETWEIVAAVDDDADDPVVDADEAGVEEGLASAGESGTRETSAAWPRLSLDPAASRAVALNLCGLSALWVAAALLGRIRWVRRWLALCLLGAGLFQVLYGARQLLAGSLQVWGVEVLGVTGRLRGTYVNPNHVSYLLEMALAVAFAVAWWAVGRARQETSLESRLILLLPPILIWLTLLAGLVLTRSRAGLVAALVAAAVQGVLVAAPRRNWRLAPAGLAAMLVGLGIVAAVGAQQSFSRYFGSSLYDASVAARLRVARAGLDLWGRFPVAGSGLGTFADAFKAVEPPGLTGSTWHHAHNAYVELAATGGIFAVLILAVGLVMLLRRLQRVLLKGRRSEDRAAALAALGALASVAVHEAFDFGLALPANAFVLVALCGAAAGAGTLRRKPRHGEGPEVAVQGGDLEEM